MNLITTRFAAAIVFSLSLLSANTAHANWIEQILNNPKIQALLGKPADILSQSQQCKSQVFRQANSQLCLDAENANIASKMPLEMRTIMSNRVSAQALRDLCLAAQGTHQQANYLCLEIVKADSSFAATSELLKMLQPVRSAD